MSLDIKQCPHCGDYFGAKLIEKHIKNCDKKSEMPSNFVCPHCKMTFSSSKELKKHQKRHKEKILAK